MNSKKQALMSCVRNNQKEIAEGLIVEMLIEHRAKVYAEAVANTLEEIRDIYGKGVEDTDIWAEYMGEKASA